MRYNGILGCVLACVAAPLAAEEYTVQRGDTLSTIADRELGRSSAWRELCEINNLPNCDRIIVGMTLQLTLAAGQSAEPEAEHDALATEHVLESPTESIESRATGVLSDQVDEHPGAIFVEVYSLDSPLGLPFRTRNNHLISASNTGKVLAGYVPDAPSSGTTGGAFIRVTDEFEQAASGRRIHIEILAASAEIAEFAVAYSTADVGNSGWQHFDATPDITTFSFQYDVPTMRNGNGDFLGVLPDLEDSGTSIMISEVILTVLAE